MERDVKHIEPVEADIDRLSPEVRAEIEKKEEQLTATLPVSAEARFAAFRAAGAEHNAYFVPRFGANGTKRYVFGRLIY